MHGFSTAKVLVVGDVMLDDYWEGETSRISPEAPVPVVHICKEYSKAGGAANVALNISALEGEVTLLGITGQDLAAKKLNSLLEAAKIRSTLDENANIPTITKLRILSQNHQLIRADFEHNLTLIDKKNLCKIFQDQLAAVNTVILSDYGKGTLSESKKMIQWAREAGKIVLVDPKNIDFSHYTHATILTPNLKEFEAVVGKSTSEKEMAEKAQKLIQKYHFTALLVTRGPEGMSLYQENQPPLHLPTLAREVFDVTGAGDTVISVLAMALSCGHPLETAMNLANTAAGVVVSKAGTATLSQTELHQAIQKNSGLAPGILDEDHLKSLILEAQQKGEVVVMTNGCFDILHAGHVDYLTEAKKRGDRLVVAINTDESVQKLKGLTRPVHSLENRMKVLSALAAVDWVVPFGEETPERLISKLLPDILIKGADYQVHEIAGAAAILKNGGRVETIQLTPACSTTATIEKIKKGEAK